MPSREVAARMRELAEKDGPYHSLDASPYCNICAALRIEFDNGRCLPHCVDVLRLLADMIDPDGGDVDE